VTPITIVGVGDEVGSCNPLPSSPKKFEPQHLAIPPFMKQL